MEERAGRERENVRDPRMAGLTRGDKNTLLSAARLALQTVVKTGRMPDLELQSPGVRQGRGVFVTLRALGQFRGSAGSLDTSVPLYRNVMDLAASASDLSPQYAPVTPTELHQVRIEIAVIDSMEPLGGVEEIISGCTGLALPGDPPVVILPATAVERDWTPGQLLEKVCIQARLPADAWAQGAPVLRFTVEVFSEEEDD